MSSDAVKMFRAIAKEDDRETERGPDKPFSTISQAFLFAAALGIVTDSKKVTKEKKHWLTRSEYFASTDRFKAMSQLIKSKFDAKTEREVVDIMIDFAEAGVRELYNEYTKTGEIDMVRISRLGS